MHMAIRCVFRAFALMDLELATFVFGIRMLSSDCVLAAHARKRAPLQQKRRNDPPQGYHVHVFSTDRMDANINESASLADYWTYKPLCDVA